MRELKGIKQFEEPEIKSNVTKAKGPLTWHLTKEGTPSPPLEQFALQTYQFIDNFLSNFLPHFEDNNIVSQTLEFEVTICKILYCVITVQHFHVSKRMATTYCKNKFHFAPNPTHLYTGLATAAARTKYSCLKKTGFTQLARQLLTAEQRKGKLSQMREV